MRSWSGLYMRLVPVLEDYLCLAEGGSEGTEGFFFEVGAWSQTLADSYLALGRVDDAVRVITDVAAGAQCPVLVPFWLEAQAVLPSARLAGRWMTLR